jgi:hypothetical protein
MSYKEDKISNDKDVAYYLMQRMCEKRTDSDAYLADVVDGMGTFDTTNTDKKWAYTMLDNIVATIKNEIGDDRCNELFKNFNNLRYFDSVFVDSKGHKYSYNKAAKSLNYLAAKYNSLTYLPNGVNRDDAYLDDRKFTKELIREMFTFVGYMLEVLRSKKEITEYIFADTVTSITSDTFGFMTSDNFDDIKKTMNNKYFVENNELTTTGLQFLASMCNIIIENDLSIINDNDHNYGKYIITLSKYGK